MKILKATYPWAMALLIFIYLFKKYPISELSQSVEEFHAVFFITYSVAYFLFIFFVDVSSLSWLLTQFGFPTRFREVVPVRLSSYLLMIFNYGAAQGLMAYFLKKTKGIPFFKSSSLILFNMMIDLYWTFTFAFVGSFFSELVIGNIRLSGVIQTVWGSATTVLVALFLFWKLPLNWHSIQWVRSRDLFHTFQKAMLSDYLILLLMRLPIHLAINTTLYFVCFAFGAHIPFFTILAFLPIAVLIGTVPITPGGLGTTQIVIIELFKNYAQPELLITMSLSFMGFNYLLKLITGSFYLKPIMSYQKATL